jgi:hypothetical protein
MMFFSTTNLPVAASAKASTRSSARNASSGDSHEAASSRGSAKTPPAPRGRPIGGGRRDPAVADRLLMLAGVDRDGEALEWTTWNVSAQYKNRDIIELWAKKHTRQRQAMLSLGCGWMSRSRRHDARARTAEAVGGPRVAHPRPAAPHPSASRPYLQTPAPEKRWRLGGAA